MKKLSVLLAISFLFISVGMSAQGRYGADSAECVKHLSYYREYYKQRNYSDALPNWQKAYELCPPTATENLFVHGATLLDYSAVKASTSEERAAVVESLMNLQEQRAQYYPKNAVKALNNKGVYATKYYKNDPQKTHEILSGIVERLGVKVTPTILENDFRSLVQLFDAGKADPVEVMDLYQKYTDIFEQIVPADDKEKELISQCKGNTQGLFLTSKVANCDELQRLFGERLEADPENLSLIKTIVSMLNSAEDCTGNDLYLRAVVAMYRMEPSSASAYALYRMNAARSNVSEAIKYIEEALSYEDLEDSKRSDYSLELAKYCIANNMLGKAQQMASKVAAFNDANAGSAYMVMAMAWAGTKCGGDEMSTRAPYWVAVDYLQKAKNADPSLAEEANNLIGRYSAYYPTAADAFMYDLTAGKSYTISCNGMTATTTVRVNK